jgi:hypothetical protein
MRKYAHADGMNEAVSFGIFLFDRLYDALSQGSTDTCNGVPTALDAFSNWYSASSFVISEIEQLEADQFEVELADQLRSRHKRAGAILEELQDSARAISAWRGGKSVSLPDFLNELRNPVHG